MVKELHMLYFKFKTPMLERRPHIKFFTPSEKLCEIKKLPTELILHSDRDTNIKGSSTKSAPLEVWATWPGLRRIPLLRALSALSNRNLWSAMTNGHNAWRLLRK
ncbi:hypothetical protein BSKO_mt0066 (mitochondrion) [Bryopsis sp. KO-2023]|nr:hypothetical protein BSKO_mt0066 [Bryopsis sp. KO-2023]